MPSPRADAFYINERLLHMCHATIRKEVSRPDPRLRLLVMATNTLDKVTDWMTGHLQHQALQKLRDSIKDEADASESASDSDSDEDEEGTEEMWEEVASTKSSLNPACSNASTPDCLITTVEVEDSDDDDVSDDEEWAGLSRVTIRDKLQAEVEVEERFQQSTKVDARPWQGVSFAPVAHLRWAPVMPNCRANLAESDPSTKIDPKTASNETNNFFEDAEAADAGEDEYNNDSETDSDSDSHFEFDSDAEEVDNDSETEEDDGLFMCEIGPKKAEAIKLKPSRSTEWAIRVMNSLEF